MAMRCGARRFDFKMMKIILALAWPTMLEQLLQTAVQYVDTAMVGSLGTQATAAVGATTTVNWLVGSTVSAFGVGFLAYIARALGAGDKEGARDASAQAVLLTLALGTLLTVITTSLSGVVPVLMRVDEGTRELASSYFLILYLPMLPRCASAIFGTVLRAAGDTRSPMKIAVLVNTLNVVLNFFFIYPTRTVRLFGGEVLILGADLGVRGAAIASAIAYTVGGISVTVVFLRHKDISPIGKSLMPDAKVLRPCLKVALPNMLQRFGTSLGYVVFASMINSLGDIATAAHTVANTVESAFYIPGYGMQTAAATLAGNAWGARDEVKLRRLCRMFIPIETLLMLISGTLLFTFSPTLVSWFTESSDVSALAVTVLKMVALSEPLYGFSIIIEGMMQGVGKTRLPFVFNVLGMWMVRIVGTFICIELLSLGLVAAWGCMIMHNVLLFVLFLLSLLFGWWNPFSGVKADEKQNAHSNT